MQRRSMLFFLHNLKYTRYRQTILHWSKMNSMHFPLMIWKFREKSVRERERGRERGGSVCVWERERERRRETGQNYHNLYAGRMIAWCRRSMTGLTYIHTHYKSELANANGTATIIIRTNNPNTSLTSVHHGLKTFTTGRSNIYQIKAWYMTHILTYHMCFCV